MDYCIVNPGIFQNFTSFYVHDPNILSDHCLIEFSLKSKTVPVCINEGINENFKLNDEENVNDMFYFKWDNAKKEDYKLNLESEQFVDSLSELTSNVCNIDNCSNVDASLSSFISSIENICKPLF